MKKGVSLIVLVITIIVMVIIAGVVIISVEDNNPIINAHETRFKTDLATVKEDAERKMQELIISGRGEFDIKTYNRTPEEMNVFVEKMPEDLKGFVIIENGEVKLTSNFRRRYPEKVSLAETIGVPVK